MKNNRVFCENTLVSGLALRVHSAILPLAGAWKAENRDGKESRRIKKYSHEKDFCRFNFFCFTDGYFVI